jgi:hypothetical protein
MVVTSAQLLRGIKTAALVPTHQTTYQDSDILAIANEELKLTVVTEIVACREEFFVKHDIVSIIAGEPAIAIPERATGRTIRDLKFQESLADSPRQLGRTPLTDTVSVTVNTGLPQTHYFEGDEIKLYPIPDANAAAGLLWVYYEQMPASLVETKYAAAILAVDSTLAAPYVDVPVTSTTFAIGSIVDIVKVKPGYTTLVESATVINIGTSSTMKRLYLTVNTDLSKVSVGDHISIERTSDILQLPDEAETWLVSLVAARLLEGQGMSDQAQLIGKRAEKAQLSFVRAITPRNEGASTQFAPQCGGFRGSVKRRIF